MKIDDLELSVRAHNTLIRAGVNTIEILDTMSDEQLLEIKNFNSKCLADVREKLREFKAGKHWEPRYQIGKDSICYGCQHFKAVEELDYEPDPEDVECGGYCDCPAICFAGHQNKYQEN